MGSRQKDPPDTLQSTNPIPYWLCQLPIRNSSKHPPRYHQQDPIWRHPHSNRCIKMHQKRSLRSRIIYTPLRPKKTLPGSELSRKGSKTGKKHYPWPIRSYCQLPILGTQSNPKRYRTTLAKHSKKNPKWIRLEPGRNRPIKPKISLQTLWNQCQVHHAHIQQRNPYTYRSQ